jgi:predicted nuclease of restriction endonuclease-like RecB superfamily
VKLDERPNGGAVLLTRTLLELSARVEGERIVINYLTERDYGWLRALLDEHVRFEGWKRTELAARLQEPLPVFAPKSKLRVAARVMDSLTRDRTVSALPPREARWRTFRAAAGSNTSRTAVLSRVASETDVSATALEAALFADLRGERRVPPLPRGLSPSSLALKSNLALVSSLLRRASSVRIVAFGGTRALVRHARVLGLICKVEPSPAACRRGSAKGSDASAAVPDQLEGAVLDISGPLALFHHTEVYGRALASLVLRVAWCNRFELTAQCVLGMGKHLSTFVLGSGDPIAVGEELTHHDSRIEERFDKDFRRAAPAWDIVREPKPIDIGGALVFPDFELVHRHRPERRWLLEIVGFWTADYLAEKLRRLKAAAIPRLILCVDERRRCHDKGFPEDAQVIWYRTWIDPAAVLRIVGK